jgi:hypothetical protein
VNTVSSFDSTLRYPQAFSLLSASEQSCNYPIGRELHAALVISHYLPISLKPPGKTGFFWIRSVVPSDDTVCTDYSPEQTMSQPFLSHQQIFDQSVAHLLSQRGASLLPRGGGAYRGKCGGCPVGALVRSNDYRTSMEGVPVRFILAEPIQVPGYMDAGVAALKRALLRARINVCSQETVDLLSCLQNVHDVFGTWEWHDRLRSIARQFSLSTQSLQQAA